MAGKDEKTKFTARYAGYVTFMGPKKIKFNKGFYETSDPNVIKHLETKCKGIVLKVKSEAEIEADIAREKAAMEKKIAEEAEKRTAEMKAEMKAAQERAKEAEKRLAELEKAAVKKGKS